MGIADKLEETLVEKAAPQAIKMLDSMTANIVPENKVSLFIQNTMPGLFAFDGVENLTGFMSKMMVAGANKEPQECAERLLVLYEELGGFFREVSGNIQEAEVVEEAEDDTPEPPTWIGEVNPETGKPVEEEDDNSIEEENEEPEVIEKNYVPPCNIELKETE